jgi:dissimilatory sulfite reductase (desulfoviridin) alpha/beta subunit
MNKELSRKGGSYEINICATCRRALDKLEGFLDKVEEDITSSGWRRGSLMSHSRLKIAASGCPNACSQVQIKDLGVIAYINPELVGECTACGECERVCREGGVEVLEVAVFNEDCIGCGDCVRACPQNAIGGEVMFRVLAGGRLGRHPRFAEVVADVSSLKEALDIIRAGIELSVEENRRLSEIENGVEKLRRVVKTDTEEIGEIRELNRAPRELSP